MDTSKRDHREYALNLLKQMIGNENDFRLGQWEAIEAIVIKKQRALVVQKDWLGKEPRLFHRNKAITLARCRSYPTDQSPAIAYEKPN